MVSYGNVKWLVKFTSANLFHASRRGVWFHVLCDAQRKHNNVRDEDSLLDMGNLCDYVDRAWGLFISFVLPRIKFGNNGQSAYLFRHFIHLDAFWAGDMAL